MNSFESFLDSEHLLTNRNLAEDDHVARFYNDRAFRFLNAAELVHAEMVDFTVAIADAGGDTGIDQRFEQCRRSAMVLNRLGQAVIDGNEQVINRIDASLAYIETRAPDDEDEERHLAYASIEGVYGTSGLVNS